METTGSSRSAAVTVVAAGTGRATWWPMSPGVITGRVAGPGSVGLSDQPSGVVLVVAESWYHDLGMTAELGPPRTPKVTSGKFIEPTNI
jgi:hypothetical protein